MKTDELVDLLAAGGGGVDAHAPAYRTATAVAAGLACAVLLTFTLLGFRATLAVELSVPMFWVRGAFCAATGAAALVCVLRLGHPGRRLEMAPMGLVLPVLAMWLLAASALLSAAPEARVALVLGQTARVCPPLIALVSVPLFGAFFWLARGLAPTRLRLAGAACGLAAGALGALAYTLHCPELAAPFLAVWYVLGMLTPALAGALLGPLLLRW